MFFKHFSALLIWCHCYQILLPNILQLLAFGLDISRHSMTISHLGPSLVSGSPTTEAAKKVTLVPGTDIALRCNILEHPEASFAWLKRKVYPSNIAKNEGLEELNSNDSRYSISKNVMIIKSSTVDDVGDYYCRVQGAYDLPENENMISVRLKPMILDFDLKSSTLKSAIVEEGQPLKISCNVVDEYYSPNKLNISWQMSKYDENDMNEIVAGEDDFELVPSGPTSLDLKIGRVTQDHRRLYKCQVTNGVTDNSKLILIRVKNKYTIIWPAVGIIIELVILIVFIIVVENRRVEPESAHQKAIHQM